MKGILIVVLVIVAAGAIYFAVTQASKEVEGPEVEVQTGSTVANLPYIDLDLPKKGVPAPGEPEWHVKVVLDRSKGRNLFSFTVTEEHNWAANGVYVELRHKGLETMTGRGMIPNRTIKILCSTAPLRFDAELHHAVTVQSHEFPELKDFGTSENWEATVCNYNDLTAPKPD